MESVITQHCMYPITVHKECVVISWAISPSTMDMYQWHRNHCGGLIIAAMLLCSQRYLLTVGSEKASTCMCPLAIPHRV